MEHTPGSRRLNPASLFVCCALALAAVGAPPLRAEPVAYTVNDRIESNLSVFGWEKGTIVEIGTGEQAGQVKILTDGRNSAGWVSVAAQKFVRKIPGKAEPIDARVPPRLGKYNILSFGPGGKHLFLGHIELLAGGKYRVSRTAEGNYFGEGAYTFDVPSKSVQWTSGPYKDEAGWGGGFEVSRQGKTHGIRLKSSTIATNSTD